MLNKDVFGQLQKGSVDEPAVVKESVHHFFKYVSGTPIKRPTWYFDTTQQGEGLVDVTTHLIDLVMWTCLPDEPIDYQKDIVMKKARRWPTMLTRQQYEKVTRAPDFPDFLKGKLNNEGVLSYYANGEMIYTMKGVHVKLAVTWNFQAPEGGGDTHHSLFRGSKANVIIVMTVMFVIYGVAGGLSAAIATNFVQGLLTIVLSFLILPFALAKVGGMSGLRQSISDPDMLSLVSPGEITLFYIIIIAFNALVGWVTMPET
ncbi:unnamed protein product, partial [marine sediment metagenome]